MIVFEDLYNDVLALENAISKVQEDIDNAFCDSTTKCVLEESLNGLKQKYNSLMNTKLDFELLNFVSILDGIERCLTCYDFDGDFSDIVPPHADTVSNCSGTTKIGLDCIESFSIWERTSTTDPNAIDRYDFLKGKFPYVIKTLAREKYVFTWDTVRDALSCKIFNIERGNISKFGNITKVVVKLNARGRALYSKDEVMACKISVKEPMSYIAPLSNGIDGNESTYPMFGTTSESGAEMFFEFYV